MNLEQKTQEQRYIHLDIVKFILVFSFMLSHFYPPALGTLGVYWNTGGFILMSGYITGILLPSRPLTFKYGMIKFLKINLWIVLYFLLVFIICAFTGEINSVDQITRYYISVVEYSYMSVLEYIALFYLFIPLLSLFTHKTLVSLFVILTTIIFNYALVYTNILQDSQIANIIRLLFIGNSSLYIYPLLSFMNIGIIGFYYSMVENIIPLRKFIMIIVIVICILVYGLNEAAIINISTDRYPPLLFYIIFSLAVFSILLDGSLVISKFITNSFVMKIITNSAKYSIIIFVIYQPVIMIINKLNIDSLMFGEYLPDLLESVAIIAMLNIFLCYIIDNTIGRLPSRIIKKLLWI